MSSTAAKVMIVMHPDDEVLWGGDALAEGGWRVICLTNGDDPIRRNRFMRAMDLFGADREIYAVPDSFDATFSAAVTETISKIVGPVINAAHVHKIVTHNPDGEYGHPAHKQLSAIVQRLVTERSRLHFFNFRKRADAALSALKQQAFEIYFPNFHKTELATIPSPQRSRTNEMSVLGASMVASAIRLATGRQPGLRALKRQVSQFFRAPSDELPQTSDLRHCAMSRYEHIVRADSYQKADELLAELYWIGRPIRTAEDVYRSQQDIYDRYPDRKYMVQTFLPACVGPTLGVGCHVFNANDCYCLPKPADYETIDISDNWKMYGSPFRHTTADFLEFTSPYRFTNILLFGVMGIPTHFDSNGDVYTLYNKDNELVRKVDELLEPGGRVLFGPDVSHDRSRSKQEKLAHWDAFLDQNEILRNGYRLIEKFHTDTNYVIVAQKLPSTA